MLVPKALQEPQTRLHSHMRGGVIIVDDVLSDPRLFKRRALLEQNVEYWCVVNALVAFSGPSVTMGPTVQTVRLPTRNSSRRVDLCRRSARARQRSAGHFDGTDDGTEPGFRGFWMLFSATDAPEINNFRL